ncbi:MAG: DUF6252 family protein [Mucilaginibacter sp.]
MKKSTCLIFSLLLAVFYGCTIPHYCCDLAKRWAEITALKNGVMWNPQYVNGTLSEIDSLKISAMNGTVTSATFNKTDTLNIKVSYIGTGTYQLNNNKVFYATFANGITTRYKIDSSYNNVLNITSYQRFDNPGSTVPNDVELKGTFDIKFIDPNNPAGISISNATFYAIIQR